MKKIISLLSVIILTLALVSCSSGSNEETTCAPGIEPDIIGTWKYESYSEYREYITTLITDPDVYYEIYYTFNADGTGETHTNKSSAGYEFTYTFEKNTLTITNSDGNSFDTVCKVDGEELTVHDDSSGENLVFIKQ